MKCLILMALLSVGAMAQEVNDPVVATVNGKQWHRDEFNTFIQRLPPQLQGAFQSNKKVWLEQYALMLLLAEQAKKDGIDKMSPYKEQIEYNNLMFLATALMDRKNSTADVTKEKLESWFKRSREQYKRARVKAIMVKWGGIPKEGETARTDGDAGHVIAEIERQLLTGAKFEDLATKYTDDPEGKKTAGDYPLIKPEDLAISPEVRMAVMPLKPGEVSKMVRMPNAMYLFKLIAFEDATLDELTNEGARHVAQEESIVWIETMRQQVKVEIKDPAFFGQR